MTNCCPFCECEVDEQVALYGGRCPKCFGDIPGEESATDPGEAVKEKLATKDARRKTFVLFAPLAFALPVLCAVIGFVAFKLLAPVPDLDVMNFDTIAVSFPEAEHLLVASLDEPTTPAPTNATIADPTPDKPRTTRVRKPRVGDKGSRLSVDEDVLAGLSAPAYDPQASPRIRSKTSADVLPDFIGAGDGQRMQTEMKLTVPTSGVVPVSVPQARLKNRAQIQRMVVGVLQRQLPRLRSCYENRLRADPNIAGKWTLSLTVTSEGGVSGARAVGQGQRDELFEDCVVKKIESWRFQRIDGTLPIQKTVAFDRR